MATYYKPQSPIQSGEDFIYPITTADQVMVDEDTRLNAVGVYLENIDNSTDTTVYGNNATTLGGVAAEDYALKTDTAPDSSKLGGKAPEYYLQPRNLLDNSDFTNPVNQRGDTSYTANGYTIDRWKILQDTGELIVNDGYVSVANKTGDYIDVVQNLNDYSRMKGGTYIIAVKNINGSVYARTFIMGQCESGKTLGGCKFFSTDSANILFRVTVSDGWYWAALYEGSYTADTLPPYVSKGYAAELAECQRYYLPVSDYWNMGVVLTGTGYICLNIPTNIKMRISPTTIVSNPRMYHPTYDWVNLTYRMLEWHAPFYRIIFDWPSNIQASISDIVLINGVTGLSADL